MLIAGAGGHALELYEVLVANGYPDEVCFYDDISGDALTRVYDKHNILRSVQEAADHFKRNAFFCLGVGSPQARRSLSAKLESVGGMLQSVVSDRCVIGGDEVILGAGLNIMAGAVITTKSIIGKGTLVHVHVSVHHDTIIGEFCELSPGCRILGGAKIGSGVSIGTNAVVMRNISVGDNATIGAGAVVTRDVLPGETVVGIPARPLHR